MKKIKVLNKDMRSPFQNFQYELGRKYTAKDFDCHKHIACSNGLYATDIEGLPYSWNIHRRAFECEVSGRQVIYDQFKQRFKHLTLIREIPQSELKERAFQKESEVGYKLSEVLFPINPLYGKPKKVTEREIELLKQWDSVWGSVWDSVWDSVGDSVGGSVWGSVRGSVWDSVGGSVWDSVWDSVGGSVRGSVWDSVWAYTSSLFPNITKWKNIDPKKEENPFRPGIDLWKRGFVPSFDEKIWRLHSGENAEIVYEIKKDEL